MNRATVGAQIILGVCLTAINGLIASYCPILLADSGMTEPQRAARLGAFSEILYGQLVRTAPGN